MFCCRKNILHPRVDLQVDFHPPLETKDNFLY